MMKSAHNGLIILVLAACGHHYGSVQGSRVVFVANTLSVEPTVTPTLELRCSLDYSNEGTMNEEETTNGTLKGVEGTFKFKGVNQIDIMRNSKVIAAVTLLTPAAPVDAEWRATKGSPNLNVTGNISQASEECSNPNVSDEDVSHEDHKEAYIGLTWSQPGIDTIGEYTCQISGFDANGYQRKKESSLRVLTYVPTLRELAKTVMDVVKNSQQLETEIQELQLENNASKTRIQELENQLKTELSDSRHIEAGVVDCGRLGGSGPRTGNAPLSRSKSVSFTTPYTASPMVHLAVQDAGINKDYYAYFYVKLVNTDTRGFTVECRMRSTSDYLGHLTVSWLSFP